MRQRTGIERSVDIDPTIRVHLTEIIIHLACNEAMMPDE
jgi:hypothetical protein